MNRVSVLIRRDPRPQRASSSLPPREDTAIRQSSVNQEEGPHKTSNLQHLDLGLPSLQNCQKQMFVVYKPLRLWYSVIAAQMD